MHRFIYGALFHVNASVLQSRTEGDKTDALTDGESDETCHSTSKYALIQKIALNF